MRLVYGLSWSANVEATEGAVPFGVGLAILIMVGLAAAGAVVMSRPGGSRGALVAGSAVASGIFFLHSLYATILTFLAELHDRGGSFEDLGYAVPLVIAAALMIGMSLAGLAPSARHGSPASGPRLRLFIDRHTRGGRPPYRHIASKAPGVADSALFRELSCSGPLLGSAAGVGSSVAAGTAQDRSE